MRKRLVLLIAALFGVLGTALAENPLLSKDSWSVYQDLRLRFEADYDSQRADGTARDDRNRGRLRWRGGFNLELDENWKAGARVRTGNHRSQQSPHLTFKTDSGDRDDLDFVVDKYFLAYGQEGYKAWLGRNSFPFWKQNELFWDDDVTPTGVASAMDLGGEATVNVGAFVLPDGGYDVHQPMAAGQLVYTHEVEGAKLTLAPGYYHLFSRGESARYLLDGNGEREYAIGAVNAKLSTTIAGIPCSIGADLYHNFEDYEVGDADPFVSEENRDEDLGYVFPVVLGKLKEQGDWLLGYYYAHIETFAVNASYAQDDWLRFGTGDTGQTRSSDFEGHEVRAAYAVLKNLNLVARWYSVDSATTIQDGSRFRLDLNYKF